MRRSHRQFQFYMNRNSAKNLIDTLALAAPDVIAFQNPAREVTGKIGGLSRCQ
jgi:hypothetical protein